MRGIYVFKIYNEQPEAEVDVLVSCFADDNEALVVTQRLFAQFIETSAELHKIADFDEKTLDVKVKRKNTLVCNFYKNSKTNEDEDIKRRLDEGEKVS